MMATGEISGPMPFEFADDFSIQGQSDALEAEREALGRERESAAYARGHDDGAAAEKASVAARTLAAIERISEKLEEMDGELAVLGERLTLDARRLAFAFARKLAGRLVHDDPVTPVSEAFAALLIDLRGQTELTVHLEPGVMAEAEARLLPELAEKLANCRVAFRADASMARGDCRIEWPSGGLVRHQQTLEARLGDLVESVIAAGQSKENGP